LEPDDVANYFKTVLSPILNDINTLIRWKPWSL